MLSPGAWFLMAASCACGCSTVAIAGHLGSFRVQLPPVMLQGRAP
jgi:hypothetical protein